LSFCLENAIMSRLFGKKSKGKGQPQMSPGDAINNLREVEGMLTKKQEYLETKISEQEAIARKNAKTNKRAALQALKRKKVYNQKLQQIDGTLTTLECQRDALDSASSNATVFKTMGEAAKALKKAHANMDVDQVHDIMDDISEQHEIANEISDAISNPVGFGNYIDEDELESELAALEEELESEEQQHLDSEMLKVGPSVVDKLPEVPSVEPVKTKKKAQQLQEDELAELSAWAS
jgi:charged multivesicular body protein 4